MKVYYWLSEWEQMDFWKLMHLEVVNKWYTSKARMYKRFQREISELKQELVRVTKSNYNHDKVMKDNERERSNAIEQAKSLEAKLESLTRKYSQLMNRYINATDKMLKD